MKALFAVSALAISLALAVPFSANRADHIHHLKLDHDESASTLNAAFDYDNDEQHLHDANTRWSSVTTQITQTITATPGSCHTHHAASENMRAAT